MVNYRNAMSTQSPPALTPMYGVSLRTKITPQKEMTYLEK